MESSRAFAERVFLVYGDERISYGEHFQGVAGLVRALIDEHGVRKGDRVVIAMRNFPDWSGAFFAAAVRAPSPVAAELRDVELGPEDDPTIFYTSFYTSGATGTPTGAFGTHRNICGNVSSPGYAAARALLREGGSLADVAAAAGPPGVVLMSVPLFHGTVVTRCCSVRSTEAPNRVYEAGSCAEM
ncbi:AMP-binding protein [Parasphingorhabdus pacifica]